MSAPENREGCGAVLNLFGGHYVPCARSFTHDRAAPNTRHWGPVMLGADGEGETVDVIINWITRPHHGVGNPS